LVDEDVEDVGYEHEQRCPQPTSYGQDERNGAI
jgi:hypothetical protein